MWPKGGYKPIQLLLALRFFELVSTDWVEVKYMPEYRGIGIIAKRKIPEGQEFRFLFGIAAKVPKDHLATIDKTHFSFTEKSRLFLGPVAYINHCCKPNGKIDRFGENVHIFKTIKEIRKGEELNWSYGNNYFGKGNKDCCSFSCCKSTKNTAEQGSSEPLTALGKKQFSEIKKTRSKNIIGSETKSIEIQNRVTAENPEADVEIPVSQVRDVILEDIQDVQNLEEEECNVNTSDSEEGCSNLESELGLSSSDESATDAEEQRASKTHLRNIANCLKKNIKTMKTNNAELMVIDNTVSERILLISEYQDKIKDELQEMTKTRMKLQALYRRNIKSTSETMKIIRSLENYKTSSPTFQDVLPSADEDEVEDEYSDVTKMNIQM